MFTLSKQDGSFFRKDNTFGVRFERILNHPVPTVWDALTKPEHLAKWLAPVTIKGDIISLQLTGGTMGGKILQWKENALLEYAWYQDSIVRWELLAEGPGRCRLVFTHSNVMESQLHGAATGWHYHLDGLGIVLDGAELPSDAVQRWESISRDAAARYKTALQEFDKQTPAPFVIERVFDVPVGRVWKALTSKEEIKQWSFDIPEFEPEEGFEFTFTGQHEDRVYVHYCRVTEVIDQRKLAYSWRYENLNGISHVTWELFPEGKKTRLRLTHEGLEKLAYAGLHFARHNFEEGWTSIFDEGLKSWLQQTTQGRPQASHH